MISARETIKRSTKNQRDDVKKIGKFDQRPRPDDVIKKVNSAARLSSPVEPHANRCLRAQRSEEYALPLHLRSLDGRTDTAVLSSRSHLIKTLAMRTPDVASAILACARKLAGTVVVTEDRARAASNTNNNDDDDENANGARKPDENENKARKNERKKKKTVATSDDERNKESDEAANSVENISGNNNSNSNGNNDNGSKSKRANDNHGGGDLCKTKEQSGFTSALDIEQGLNAVSFGTLAAAIMRSVVPVRIKGLDEPMQRVAERYEARASIAFDNNVTNVVPTPPGSSGATLAARPKPVRWYDLSEPARGPPPRDPLQAVSTKVRTKTRLPASSLPSSPSTAPPKHYSLRSNALSMPSPSASNNSRNNININSNGSKDDDVNNINKNTAIINNSNNNNNNPANLAKNQDAVEARPLVLWESLAYPLVAWNGEDRRDPAERPKAHPWMTTLQHSGIVPSLATLLDTENLTSPLPVASHEARFRLAIPASPQFRNRAVIPLTNPVLPATLLIPTMSTLATPGWLPLVERPFPASRIAIEFWAPRHGGTADFIQAIAAIGTASLRRAYAAAEGAVTGWAAAILDARRSADSENTLPRWDNIECECPACVEAEARIAVTASIIPEKRRHSFCSRFESRSQAQFQQQHQLQPRPQDTSSSGVTADAAAATRDDDDNGDSVLIEADDSAWEPDARDFSCCAKFALWRKESWRAEKCASKPANTRDGGNDGDMYNDDDNNDDGVGNSKNEFDSLFSPAQVHMPSDSMRAASTPVGSTFRQSLRNDVINGAALSPSTFSQYRSLERALNARKPNTGSQEDEVGRQMETEAGFDGDDNDASNGNDNNNHDDDERRAAAALTSSTIPCAPSASSPMLPPPPLSTTLMVLRKWLANVEMDIAPSFPRSGCLRARERFRCAVLRSREPVVAASKEDRQWCRARHRVRIVWPNLAADANDLFRLTDAITADLDRWMPSLGRWFVDSETPASWREMGREARSSNASSAWSALVDQEHARGSIGSSNERSDGRWWLVPGAPQPVPCPACPASLPIKPASAFAFRHAVSADYREFHYAMRCALHSYAGTSDTHNHLPDRPRGVDWDPPTELRDRCPLCWESKHVLAPGLALHMWFETDGIGEKVASYRIDSRVNKDGDYAAKRALEVGTLSAARTNFPSVVIAAPDLHAPAHAQGPVSSRNSNSHGSVSVRTNAVGYNAPRLMVPDENFVLACDRFEARADPNENWDKFPQNRDRTSDGDCCAVIRKAASTLSRIFSQYDPWSNHSSPPSSVSSLSLATARSRLRSGSASSSSSSASSSLSDSKRKRANDESLAANPLQISEEQWYQFLHRMWLTSASASQPPIDWYGEGAAPIKGVRCYTRDVEGKRCEELADDIDVVAGRCVNDVNKTEFVKESAVAGWHDIDTGGDGAVVFSPEDTEISTFYPSILGSSNALDVFMGGDGGGTASSRGVNNIDRFSSRSSLSPYSSSARPLDKKRVADMTLDEALWIARRVCGVPQRRRPFLFCSEADLSPADAIDAMRVTGNPSRQGQFAPVRDPDQWEAASSLSLAYVSIAEYIVFASFSCDEIVDDAEQTKKPASTKAWDIKRVMRRGVDDARSVARQIREQLMMLDTQYTIPRSIIQAFIDRIVLAERSCGKTIGSKRTNARSSIAAVAAAAAATAANFSANAVSISHAASADIAGSDNNTTKRDGALVKRGRGGGSDHQHRDAAPGKRGRKTKAIVAENETIIDGHQSTPKVYNNNASKRNTNANGNNNNNNKKRAIIDLT